MAEARPPQLSDWYSRQGMQVNGGSMTLAGGGHIKAGQTAYNVGTGFYMGFSGGAYKFSIGNASGNRLTWDGTTLTVIGTIALGSSVAWSSISGAGKPADNADVTLSAVNGGLTVTGGGITLSGGGSIKGGKTAYGSGTGFFLGYSGGAYVFDIGSASNYLRWTGSALSILGDITGASNVTISGNAIFTGVSVSGTISAAIIGKTSGPTATGVAGVGIQGTGCRGESTDGVGVDGYSTTWTGVAGTSNGNATTAGVVGNGGANGAAGVWAKSTGGVALKVEGTMTTNNSTLVTNLNAQYLNGNASTAFATSGHNHSGVYLPIAGTAANSTQWNTNACDSSPTTGAGVATFNASNKPGASTTNTWWQVVVGGSIYLIPIWPA